MMKSLLEDDNTMYAIMFSKKATLQMLQAESQLLQTIEVVDVLENENNKLVIQYKIVETFRGIGHAT